MQTIDAEEAIGLDVNGSPGHMTIERNLATSLDQIKVMVKKRNWDYVCIVAGIPGAGKSVFARHTIARYLCPWFKNAYTVFSAEEFLKVTNECPEYSAIVLDESFESLNSRKTMSKQFLKIVNHLQLIRQKHLFLILCLPNFFDLSKGIAIFRSSHLFVVYADDEGRRGRFLAFGRDVKRKLYILGSKYMNYGVVKANFVGEFRQNRLLLDDVEYEKMKRAHLFSQNKALEGPIDSRVTRAIKITDNAIFNLKKRGYLQKEMAEILGIGLKTVQQHYAKLKEDKKITPEILELFKRNWNARESTYIPH